jgi:hypothetical protein
LPRATHADSASRFFPPEKCPSEGAERRKARTSGLRRAGRTLRYLRPAAPAAAPVCERVAFRRSTAAIFGARDRSFRGRTGSLWLALIPQAFARVRRVPRPAHSRAAPPSWGGR